MTKRKPRKRGSFAGSGLEPLLQRARDLQHEGCMREAEHCYQLVLREAPAHPDALGGLGVMACLAKRFHLSIGFLERAVRATPKDAALRCNLANSCILAGMPEKALPHLRKALTHNPKLIEAHMNAARANRALGRADKAHEAYGKALSLRPGFAPARIGIAETLTELGLRAEAATLFAEILDDHPDNGAAIAGLALTHSFSTQDANTIEAIERSLASGTFEGQECARVHHAAGKIRDDLGEHDKAFAHFTAAKQAVDANFDIAAYRRFVASSCTAFGPAFFAQRKGLGAQTETPVFIVGMPRSGTTLTEQIIASHPKASGAGELRNMETISFDLTGQRHDTEGYAERLGTIDANALQAQAKRYLAALKRHGRSALRVTDKMPHNFEVLGLIALLFPNARIIHCTRAPLDTCLSCYTHHFNKIHGYTSDLTTLGLYYREYAKLMAHWKAVLPLPIFELRYEDMVQEQEATTRRLIDHLGLDWNDACLHFHQTNRPIQTPSRLQVREPIYADAIGRWRRYEAHLGPLMAALGDLGTGE